MNDMVDGQKATFKIGAEVPRVEDARFLAGRGIFVDDLHLPGMAYAFIVRSPHPHARIHRIETTFAAQAPGVLAVLTGKDVVNDGLGSLQCMVFPRLPPSSRDFRPMQPVLAHGKVRHVGFPVALVVADTLSQAKDAAELVDVEYEPLRPVPSLEAALEPDASAVWDEADRNIWFAMERGDRDAVDSAFVRAAHVIQITSRFPRSSANPIEPRAAIGCFDRFDRRYTLYTGTQQPHRAREFLASKIFHVPETSIRVVTQDVGGAFGMRGTVYPEEILVLWAAGKLDRPVKWTGERSECLMSDTHGRDQRATAELALDADGMMLAMRASLVTNVGAYLGYSAGVPPSIALTTLSSVYQIPHVHADVRAVFTNTNPLGPYRGTGRPETTLLIEKLVEKAARILKMSSIELRRRNVIKPAAMPYTTAGGNVMDCGDLELALDNALALADLPGFPERKRKSERAGVYRGLGVGLHGETAGGGHSERMEVSIDPSGAVTVYAGTVATGQSHETMYAQMISEWLGVPVSHVRVRQGDTDKVMFGRGSYASRSAMVGGSALKCAVESVIQTAKEVAAHAMEVAPSDIEFSDGAFQVAGTDKRLALREVARRAYAPAGLPPELGIGLEAKATYYAPESFPYGCMVCEVEVDPSTGVVSIDRFCFVDDVGVAINPLVVQGQSHGSIGMGVGQVLMEEMIFDGESGQLLSGSFGDYCMPRADCFPSFKSGFVVIPTKTNPLGVKGGSEAGNFGAPPAVINALMDALAPLGVNDVPLPATAERVWRAINQARATSGGNGN